MFLRHSSLFSVRGLPLPLLELALRDTHACTHPTAGDQREREAHTGRRVDFASGLNVGGGGEERRREGTGHATDRHDGMYGDAERQVSLSLSLSFLGLFWFVRVKRVLAHHDDIC